MSDPIEILDEEQNLPLPPSDDDDDETLYEHHRILVDGGQEPIRLDKFLVIRLPRVTRNRLQKAIKGEFVKVNEKAVKPNYLLRPHDVVTVCLPEPVRDLKNIAPEPIDLPIFYEDDDILLINKPANLVAHPASENWSGTLANGVVHYLQQQGLPFFGLSHRLDKDTTGLLVVPKNENARDKLGRQFFHHTIERTYYALVWGEVKDDKGTIRGNLARWKNDRRIMIVEEDGSRGKHAVTHYEVLKRLRYVTLVKCNLETGRTHQIRAHMKHLGHPLFGDAPYGGTRIIKGSVFSKYLAFVQNCFEILPRQALHAKSLGFKHPKDERWVQFESELPEDFKTVLERWEKYVKYV
jgi:23S rRNA pseudouridine1911/1915/1917 synthase